MGDLQRQALARDLARRLQLASHDELRVLDRLLLRLELGREHYGLLDLSVPRDWSQERAEELLDAVLYDAMGDLAAEDRAREQLREAARDEMVPPLEPKFSTPAARLEYILYAAQVGAITVEAAREMIEATELVNEWRDEGTVISSESQAIARTVTAERSDPYETVVVDVDDGAG